MPSAASSIARFALAARSAAATTTRFARLAERAALSTKAVAVECQAPSLGSHRAASGDLHLHRSPVALPPPATGAPASLTLSYLKEPKPEGRVKFVVEEKDLESEEALWSLYERWCKAFNQERDHDEMVRWFNTFKKTVKFVHRRNSADLPNKLEINKFTDGKLRIPCSSPDPLLTRIEKEFGDSPVEFIPTDDGKLYRRVFADYKVVDGKLYVDVPKGGDLKTITTKPEYVLGGSAGNHHHQP